MNTKEKELVCKVVSVETGEIVDEIYTGDKIVHQKDKVETDIIYDFNSDKPFVKLYLGVTKLRKYLTPGEFAITISLADFICYDDCILRKGGHKNGKVLTMKDLAEEMDLNYDYLRKTFSTLRKKGIISLYEIGNKNNSKDMKLSDIPKGIVVNPHIFTKGTNLNKTILGMFSDSDWDEQQTKELFNS